MKMIKKLIRTNTGKLFGFIIMLSMLVALALRIIEFIHGPYTSEEMRKLSTYIAMPILIMIAISGGILLYYENKHDHNQLSKQSLGTRMIVFVIGAIFAIIFVILIYPFLLP